MKKFFEEFKEFALQGNVFDMAIGVVIGGAFSAIVGSLVSDIITPIIGLIANSENLETLQWVLRPAEGEKEALVLRYGAFIDTVFSFLIIASIIFMVIKLINRLKREEPVVEEEEAVAEPSAEELLLTEILETLKNK